MENKSSGSVRLSTLLLVLFVGLKLTGYINWSWWLVLTPFWVPFIFGVVGLMAIHLARVSENFA